MPLSAAAEADPAVLAFRRWIEVAHERHSYRPPDGRDWPDDPRAVEIDAEEEEAAGALAEAVPTTPAGATGMVHLMLALVWGQHERSSDIRDPETFSGEWMCSSDFIEEATMHAGRTLVRVLPEMAG